MKMGVSELAAEVEVGAEEAAELEVRAEAEVGAGVKVEALRGHTAAALVPDIYPEVPHVLVLDQGHHIVRAAKVSRQTGWRRNIFHYQSGNLLHYLLCLTKFCLRYLPSCWANKCQWFSAKGILVSELSVVMFR